MHNSSSNSSSSGSGSSEEEEEEEVNTYPPSGEELGQGKRLVFEDQSPSPSPKRHQTSKNDWELMEFDKKLFNQVWLALKQRGWTIRNGRNMSTWIYLAPSLANKPLKEGVENVTLFSTEESLFDHVQREMPKVFKEIVQQEEDSAKSATRDDAGEEEWKSLWSKLQKQGWRMEKTSKGGGIKYILPRQSTSNAAAATATASGQRAPPAHFCKREDVIKYCNSSKSASGRSVAKKPTTTTTSEDKLFSELDQDVVKILRAAGCTTKRHLKLLAVKSELELMQLLPKLNTGQALVLRDSLSSFNL